MAERVTATGLFVIVSCHVPKTAGTTLARLWRRNFGRRLHLDYGDRVGWTGPEADEWRRSRASKRLPRRTEVVHGHFYASKYAVTQPEATFVAFVREPVDRVISNYRYLRAHPEIVHPLVGEFHAAQPSLEEWVTWTWARNLQSSVLDLPWDRFALLGLTEQFERSLRSLDQRCGTSLAALGRRRHRNASTGVVEVDEDMRARIATLNDADVELYRYAAERFEREAVAPAEDAQG